MIVQNAQRGLNGL